jgi:hypothetical protein
VRYDAMKAMLLNEFLKEHSKVEEQGAVEELKKQVAALTAGLQKVSAQLELSKAAPQTVNNSENRHRYHSLKSPAYSCVSITKNWSPPLHDATLERRLELFSKLRFGESVENDKTNH